MPAQDRNRSGRWAGLAAVVFLLAVLGLALVIGRPAAAGQGPPSYPPALAPSHAVQTARDRETWAASGSVLPRVMSQPAPVPWQSAGAPPLAARSDTFVAAALYGPLSAGANAVVCTTTGRVWGLVGPGQTATVEANGVQMGAALADALGFFWTTLYDAGGSVPALSGGQTVSVYSAGSLQASTILRPITGHVDAANDLVTGQIGGGNLPIDVTVYATGGEPATNTYSQTVRTDASGNFVASFAPSFDFMADEAAVVSYVEHGVEVHRHVYADRLTVLPAPHNLVVGWAPPGAAITATAYLPGGTTVRQQVTGTAGARDGRYELSLQMQTGDTVAVEVPGRGVLMRKIDPLTIVVDAAQDRLSGMAAPGAVVRGRAEDLTTTGWRTAGGRTVAQLGGQYSLNLGAVADLMPGQWAAVCVADAEGDDLCQWAPSPSVEVDQTWNEVTGRGPAPLGPDSQGRVVTLTLASTGASYTTVTDWWGWYLFEEEKHGLPDITAGEVVTVEAAGYPWQGVVEVKPVSVQFDMDADRIDGAVEMPTGRVELRVARPRSALYPARGWFDRLAAAGSPFGAVLPGFDLDYNQDFVVGHRTAADYLERIAGQTDGFGVLLPFNAVVGIFAPPGTPYTLTLYTAAGGLKTQMTGVSQGATGDIGWQDLGSTGQSVAAGDRLQLQAASGFSYTLEIPTLTIQGDPDQDLVRGQGPPDSLLLVDVWDQGSGFVPTDANGDFAVAVDQLQQFWGDGDLRPGHGGSLVYLDGHLFGVYTEFQVPFARTNIVWDNVDGWFGPGATVWYTVTGALGEHKGGGSGTADASGWMGGVWCNCDIAPGDQVAVLSDAGFDAVLVPISITGQIDVEADQVRGQMAGGDFPGQGEVWVWSEGRGEGAGRPIEIAASGTYTASYGPGAEEKAFDLQNGDRAEVWYYDAHGNHLGTELHTLRIEANYAHDWIYAETVPHATLAITVAGKATLTAQADASGRFWGWAWQELWVPAQPDLAPGDAISVTAGGYLAAVNPVGQIEGEVDTGENTVAGTIHAPWFGQPLRGWCEVWVDGGPPGIEIQADPDGGSYTCDFDDVGWDLEAGQDVAVRYMEPDGDAVINVFGTPWMRVNVGDNWVGGNYPAGHTVWITATDSGGALKATAELVSTASGGWGGEGFETRDEDWSPARPDLAAGDRVQIEADDDYQNTIHAGNITGELDLAANTVAGTVQAEWFNQPLRLRCEVWYVDHGPGGIETTVDPQGGSYACDFDDVGWDLLPGHGAAVLYYEPDGDVIINVFSVPAFNLRVNYGDDWVESFYEAGHTVWLTVTHSDGSTVKATAQVTTADIPAGGGSGFQTVPEDWSPAPPDIRPEDRVYGLLDSGEAAEVQVGTVAGRVRAGTDSIAGTIYAPWIGQEVDVECHSWGKPGDEVMKYDRVLPDGQDVYTCAWDPDTEWDIEPGQIVGVGYSEPAGNWVANSFSTPFPAYLPVLLKSQ